MEAFWTFLSSLLESFYLWAKGLLSGQEPEPEPEPETEPELKPEFGPDNENEQ